MQAVREENHGRRMTKLSKRDHAMPGWVSNGNVQINVARDLHIHGGARSIVDMPCDVAPSRGDSDSSGWWTAAKIIGILLAAAIAIPILLSGAVLAGVLFAGVCLLGFCGVVGIWLVCRLFEGCLWAEKMAGGGRTRLVYAPSFMRPDNMPRLGSGKLNELEGLNQLESDYVD
jgi:hypothetical protein